MIYADTWQPFSTAPKDGEALIACCAGDERWHTIFYYDYDKSSPTWEHDLGDDFNVAEFTHWMRPEPPKDDQPELANAPVCEGTCTETKK